MASCTVFVNLGILRTRLSRFSQNGFYQLNPRRLASTRAKRRISFLTDVEGDAAYFNRFVENSRILTFRETEPNIDATAENFFPYTKCVDFCDSNQSLFESMLVFGGDICDKGGSDLYVLRQIMSLHSRYPQRVHLIMGNRDINKMRIIPEIGLDNNTSVARNQTRQRLPFHGGCWWLAGTGRAGDPTRDFASSGVDSADSKVPSESASARLQWMLANTMGCPKTFELRREELGREHEFIHKEERCITDEEVVKSFQKVCHPKGEVGRYLASAQLVIKLGSALFLHGALPQQGLKPTPDHEMKPSSWPFAQYAMPWLQGDGDFDLKDITQILNIDDWTNRLNSFAQEQVRMWARNMYQTELDEQKGVWATKGGYNDPEFDYSNLLQFGMGWMPDKSKNQTIVYSSWLNDGMPRRFMDHAIDGINGAGENSYKHELTTFMDQTGLQLVVTGHQPHGDHPTPINISDEKKTRFIIPCDTSYSYDTKWISGTKEDCTGSDTRSSSSGRGDLAVCEILIDQYMDGDGAITSTILHGALSNGQKYESVNLFDPSNEGKSLASIGTPIKGSDGEMWWVKSRMKTEKGHYLLSKGKGFAVFNLLTTQPHLVPTINGD